MRRLLGALLLGFAFFATARATEPRPQPELLVPDPGAEWRETGRLRTKIGLTLLLAEQVVTIAFLGWLAFSGAGGRLRARLPERVDRRRSLRNGTVLAAMTIALFLVDLPFDLARYTLSRHFGVGRQPFGSWLKDDLLALVVHVASALFIGLLFYWVVRWRPTTWWRWVTAAALPFAVGAVLVSPLYIGLFNTLTPLADRPLADRILALAARADIPAGEVYVIDMSRQTRAANAFVTGIGPTTTVALGDTLLAGFRDDETLFVTAHEMGHYVKKHLWIGAAVAAVFTAFGAFALQRLLAWAMRRYETRLGFDELSDIASLPLVLLAVTVLTFVADPAANAVSRKMESDADRFALELTVPGDVSPEAAVSTFERLGQLALSDPNPNPILRFLYWSHPTLDEREAAVRRWAASAGH
jgi:Zn-dependent protease with chaperone function